MREVSLLLLFANTLSYLALQVWFTSYLRYLCVCLSFSLSLTAFAEGTGGILPYALLFTLAADYCFMVCSPPRVLLAVSLFIVVQVLYFWELEKGVPAFFVLLAVAARILFLLLFACFLWKKGSKDPLVLLAGIYGATLFENVVQGVVAFRRRPFVLGLVFFLFCDTFLALSYLFQRGEVFPMQSLDLSLFCRRMEWAFYPQSQVFIAFSALENSAMFFSEEAQRTEAFFMRNER